MEKKTPANTPAFTSNKNLSPDHPDPVNPDARLPDREPLDIKQIGWWRHLPAPVHPYFYLARFDRPIGSWLLLMPAWWVIPAASAQSGSAINPVKTAWLMLLFLIGAVVTRAAGCVINDMWDRRLDQNVERTAKRPLAAGTITMTGALFFLAALSLVGLYILVQLPLVAIITGFAAVPLVILYPLAKRVTWWPQAVLGLTFSWGVPLGWTATTGQIPTPDLLPDLLIIYAGSICWVFGYDTIYAVQDMADDALVGVKSAALGLGRFLHHGVGCAYLLAVLFLGAGLFRLLGPGIWMAGLTFAAAHFIWQVRLLDADDPAGAGYLFKSNRDAGLLLSAGITGDMIVRYFIAL